MTTPQATIWLTPGVHVIDGAVVDVPVCGDKDLVEHPMTAGRHVVDNRVCIVPSPGASVRIPIKTVTRV